MDVLTQRNNILKMYASTVYSQIKNIYILLVEGIEKFQKKYYKILQKHIFYEHLLKYFINITVNDNTLKIHVFLFLTILTTIT